MPESPKTDFYAHVTNLLQGECVACSFILGEFTIVLDTSEKLLRCVTLLRDHPSCLFSQLLDITAVDYLLSQERFEMVYHFLSMEHNKRLRMKFQILENEAVPSLTSVFSCASWYEREIFDLFGIHFKGHSDLRRILTDYNFKGHPLRKDFPLSGYYEVRYDHEAGKVIYEPVALPEAFRDFDYLSPWEGMLEGSREGYTLPLPGDEKSMKNPQNAEEGA